MNKKRGGEQTMSDVEPEDEGELDEVHAEDLDDEEYDEDEEEVGEPPSASVGRNFQKLPEDGSILTLVGFAKLLAKPRRQGGRWVSVKPQVLYSTAKNTKSFPAYQYTDGRWVINVQEGLEWWDNKEQRKADRAAEAQAAMGAEEEEETDEVDA